MALRQLDRLCEDDPLPPDLSFLAEEASTRYTVLGLTSPGTWSVELVREVFPSRKDMIDFLIRHFTSQKQQ